MRWKLKFAPGVAVWGMSKRTYVDACVLIAAFRATGELGRRAIEILDDPDRTLVVSDAVRLEVLPKPRFHRHQKEVDFYEAIFEQSESRSWNLETLQHAHTLAEAHGIAAMDAIHVATALDAEVDEFVSAEKSTKPMFNVYKLKMYSIREGIA
jgi:predicted nucleic acid-binding protein